MNSDQKIQATLNDPATSYWLREAITASMHRAPLDVANDAEALALLFAHRAKDQAEKAIAWVKAQNPQKI